MPFLLRFIGRSCEGGGRKRNKFRIASFRSMRESEFLKLIVES